MTQLIGDEGRCGFNPHLFWILVERRPCGQRCWLWRGDVAYFQFLNVRRSLNRKGFVEKCNLDKTRMWLMVDQQSTFTWDRLWEKARSKMWLAKNCMNGIKKVTTRSIGDVLNFLLYFKVFKTDAFHIHCSMRFVVIFWEKDFDHWSKFKLPVCNFYTRRYKGEISRSFYVESTENVWRYY